MRIVTMFLSFLIAGAGCASVCDFGRSSDPNKKMQCYGMMDKAKIGMSQKDVEKEIGYPNKRRYDISYMGKSYDEAWVYSVASPPTVLYFRNGIVEKKDYDYNE